MDDRATEPLRVPLYERAEIRPEELAALRRQLVNLGSRLVQVEGERDAYEGMIRALLFGLGFDADHWPISLEGMGDAARTLLDLAAGKYRREDCPVIAGTVIEAVFELREKAGDLTRGRVYPLRRERGGE